MRVFKNELNKFEKKLQEIEQAKNTYWPLTLDRLDKIEERLFTLENSKKLMDFSAAFKKMKEGKKVNRTCWPDSDFIFIRDNTLFDDHGNKINYLGSQCMMGTDWYIVE